MYAQPAHRSVITGIKPTSRPHLGNYVGAIRPALEWARSPHVRSLVFIADSHALTTAPDPKALHHHIREVAATWMALGLDPKRTIFYRQSAVPEIFEMAWILACFSPKSWMNKAHAYKASVAANLEGDADAGINMGMYSYPILMASDILCLGADEVPVGKDQLQHIEIARDLAKRINRLCGAKVLKEPRAWGQDRPILPGVDGRKMSKSYDNCIGILDEPAKIKKAINHIVTDSSDPEAAKDPETSIVFQIYSQVASEEDTARLRKRFEEGISWGEAKSMLASLVSESFAAPRARYNELMESPAKIESALESGGCCARALARPVLTLIRKRLGLEV